MKFLDCNLSVKTQTDETYTIHQDLTLSGEPYVKQIGVVEGGFNELKWINFSPDAQINESVSWGGVEAFDLPAEGLSLIHI